jgi:hypothetical protein
MAVFDRLAAVLLGLALLVVGVLVPVEIVHAAVLSRTGELLLPWQTLTRFFTGHDWSTSPVLAISILTAVIGLLLLLAELKRRRPGLLTLATDDENLTAGTTRRSVQRALAARAEDVDGISAASAKVRRGRASVAATTGQREPGDLQTRLTEQLTGWLEDLGLVNAPRLRVRLTSRED